MKKILVFSVFVSMLFLSSCGKPVKSSEMSPSSSSIIPTPTTTPTATPTDPYHSIDKFISSFNSISESDIVDPQEIDIHDDEHYRVEFRLGAFDDALAKEGFSGGCKLEMVNYGAFVLSGFRVYGQSDTYEDFQTCLEACVTVFDPTITQEMIEQKVYSCIEDGGPLSTAFSFYLNDVNCFYQKDENIYTFMVDQSIASFLND